MEYICVFATYRKGNTKSVVSWDSNHQLNTTGLNHPDKSMKHDGSPSGARSAAGPLWVLRVDGQVVERGLRGAGVPG